MYHILMPVDASEDRALAQARTAAALPNAADSVEVTLLHVFDDRDAAEKTSVVQTVAGKRARERLTDGGVTIHQESRSGEPAEEILAAAEELDADLIVLGGRKRSPLGSVLFGSVSQSVLLDADRPVTITGEGSAEREAAEQDAAGRESTT